MGEKGKITCPFCGFKDNSEYDVQSHIEQHHTEGSPFAVGPAPALSNGSDNTKPPHPQAVNGMPSDTWTKCTRPSCGEYVLISEIDEHLDIHEATAASMEENHRPKQSPPSPRRNVLKKEMNGSRSPKQSSRSSASRPSSSRSMEGSETSEGRSHGRSLLEYFSGSSSHGRPPPRQQYRMKEPRAPGRLGKRELGPHAFEEQMPPTVRHHLLNDAQPYHTNRIGSDGRLTRTRVIENETGGLVPILADLCAIDKDTLTSYFCHPALKHIHKLRCDGNFCGYWNIQMVLSQLNTVQSPTSHAHSRSAILPNVLEIQDTIEQAWDADVCPYGRIETGGVRGTRKWIGTHEALAYFTFTGVKVDALSFKEGDGPGESVSAVSDLLDYLEAYFISGLETATHAGSSHITSLPPIYFQRFGHSMTVVGLERKHDGSRNLLVFDPSFATSEAMRRLVDGRGRERGRTTVDVEVLLKAYRRSDVSLSRWDEFEVVVPQNDFQMGKT